MKNLLVYAGMGLTLSSVALWPTVLIHVAMAAWCVTRLLDKPARVS